MKLMNSFIVFLIFLTLNLQNIEAYPVKALDWSAFKVQSGGASYTDTKVLSGDNTPTVEILISVDSGVLSLAEPVSLPQTLDPSVMVNTPPYMGFGFKNASANTSPINVSITATSGVLVRPGDAFYISELQIDTLLIYSTITDFIASAGITNANADLAPTNADISPGLTADLIYDAGAGTITPVPVAPVPRNTGGLFLKNTGGSNIDSISFTLNPVPALPSGDLVVFGVGTPVPEPSTYLILGSMLVLCLIALRKKRLLSR